MTVDHMSGGRLEFGIGAGWLGAEHSGYGIEFPMAAARVEMLDEALTVIKRRWTEDSVTHFGRLFTPEDALANPKPLQRPHPPIVIGGVKPKMLKVIAKHAVNGTPQARVRRSGARQAPISTRPALRSFARST